MFELKQKVEKEKGKKLHKLINLSLNLAKWHMDNSKYIVATLLDRSEIGSCKCFHTYFFFTGML